MRPLVRRLERLEQSNVPETGGISVIYCTLISPPSKPNKRSGEVVSARVIGYGSRSREEDETEKEFLDRLFTEFPHLEEEGL